MARPDQALVVADGDVDLALLTQLAGSQPRPWLVAADGGAGRILAAGLVPDLVVGDFDSLVPAARSRLEALGVELRQAPPDKDESDTELCLLSAIAAGARRVTLVGALGLERPEHSAANLLLLADPRLDGVEVVIAGRGSRLRRIGTAGGPGTVRLAGSPADYVSLLPLDDAVEGVTTEGLRFPLRGERLSLGPSRGLSNELTDDEAFITTTRGRLLVVHTDRAAEDQ